MLDAPTNRSRHHAIHAKTGQVNFRIRNESHNESHNKSRDKSRDEMHDGMGDGMRDSGLGRTDYASSFRIL